MTDDLSLDPTELERHLDLSRTMVLWHHGSSVPAQLGVTQESTGNSSTCDEVRQELLESPFDTEGQLC